MVEASELRSKVLRSGFLSFMNFPSRFPVDWKAGWKCFEAFQGNSRFSCTRQMCLSEITHFLQCSFARRDDRIANFTVTPKKHRKATRNKSLPINCDYQGFTFQFAGVRYGSLCRVRTVITAADFTSTP